MYIYRGKIESEPTIEDHIISRVASQVDPRSSPIPDDPDFRQVIDLTAEWTAHNVTVPVLHVYSVYPQLQGEPLYGPAIYIVPRHVEGYFSLVWGGA